MPDRHGSSSAKVLGDRRATRVGYRPMKSNSYSGLAEANLRSETQPMTQRIIPSAGETYWVVGHRVTILPAGAGYGYIDVFSPGCVTGPPPHRHTDCSEL